LDDCAAAVQWVAANRPELGVSHLIVSGESGGGNLTLAVAHKSKRDGCLAQIAGVYALCPFISNRWLEQPDELPSLTENEDYLASNLAMALIGSVCIRQAGSSGDVADPEKATGLSHAVEHVERVIDCPYPPGPAADLGLLHRRHVGSSSHALRSLAGSEESSCLAETLFGSMAK
jgi:hypothetical protein